MIGVGSYWVIRRKVITPAGVLHARMNRVAEGDLSTSPELEALAGGRDEVGQLAGALNTACEALGRAIGETVGVMEAVAAGNLSKRITADTKGEVKKMADALNASLDQIAAALGDVRAVMTAAAAGDLTRRVTAGTRGDIRTIADALNDSLDKMVAILVEVRSSVDAVGRAAPSWPRPERRSAPGPRSRPPAWKKPPPASKR